nr:hypothetical protein [Nannocystis sp. RBIL2]
MPYFSRLIGLKSPETSSEPAMKALPLRGLGLVALAEDEPQMAVMLLQRALAILEQAPLERLGLREIMIETMRALADAHTALRSKPQRARELRRRAAELESAN